MKKIAASIALLVSWQAFSAPMIQPVIPSDILAGHKETSIVLQSAPLKVNVEFKTTGYTIFGVLYVAAAIAKMKSQSEALQKTYDQLAGQSTDKRTLNEIFDQELKQDLAKDGISLVSVNKLEPSGNADDLAYQVVADSFKTDKLLVFDRLKAGYYAPSSTDPYSPAASVLLTVFEHKTEQPLHFVSIATTDTQQKNYTYTNFEALAKDPGQSYEGLKLSITRLAHQLAERIGGFAKAGNTPAPGGPNTSSNAAAALSTPLTPANIKSN